MTLNPIWPPHKRAKTKNKYNRGITDLKKVILVSKSMFFSMIYSRVHLKMHSRFQMTWNPIWPPPKRAKVKNKYNRGIIELKKVILLPNSMFVSMIYSLVHLKNAHIVHMTWNPIWPPPKMAKMTNKGNFGIIEPRNVILVCNSMLVSVIYSLVLLKCTKNSNDMKSNMATIESPKMLSLIYWYSSQKFRATNQTKETSDGRGNQMCCKNSNKAVTWSMFRSVSYGVSFPQTIQAVQVDGAQLRWGLPRPWQGSPL